MLPSRSGCSNSVVSLTLKLWKPAMSLPTAETTAACPKLPGSNCALNARGATVSHGLYGLAVRLAGGGWAGGAGRVSTYGSGSSQRDSSRGMTNMS